ncbi:hypothetical protein RvY_09646 [Ramazzottius varieornatus]|uniref:Tetraspanin n=1 Tax=Ramazzottius varieornatus TaxID=947166 RepID=A0A1D1VA36_RAMVA|nr:hypothetical protein RvY_09646 [Ramazzottius varieornatus]
MLRGGVQCIRIAFIVLNILVGLASCAALGLGIWLHIKDTGVTRLNQTAFLNATSFIIAAACVGILVCIMGCFGSVAHNRCLLLTYFIVVLALFLAEFGLGMYFLIFRDTITDNVRYDLKLSMKISYLPHSTQSAVWDSIQTNFQCCGVDSPTDWHFIPAWNELPITPDSCCIPEHRSTQRCGLDYQELMGPDGRPRFLNAKAYPRGCFQAIRDYATRNMYIFAIAAVILAFVQLFGLVSSMVLFCSGSTWRQEKRDKLIVVEEPEFVEIVDVPPPRPPKPIILQPAARPYVETNL